MPQVSADLSSHLVYPALHPSRKNIYLALILPVLPSLGCDCRICLLRLSPTTLPNNI